MPNKTNCRSNRPNCHSNNKNIFLITHGDAPIVLKTAMSAFFVLTSIIIEEIMLNAYYYN